MKTRTILVTGSVFGFLAVSIGAFGAHAFKSYLLEINRLETYETAVQYQFYHALALMFIGVLSAFKPHKLLSVSAIFMTLGILFFSGSLYVLCLTNQPVFGAITPFGGIFFLIGWAILIYLYGIKKAGNHSGLS